MKKPTILLAFGAAVFTVSLSYAQSLNPQAVNSAGISMAQSNGSLNFTVGDLVIETHTDAAGNTLGGGVINSAVVSSTFVSLKELSIENMEVTLFPNPTSEWLNIEFAQPLDEAFSIDLVDARGKTLHSKNYPGGQTFIQLNAAHWATGTYLVHIRTRHNDRRATYQIVISK